MNLLKLIVFITKVEILTKLEVLVFKKPLLLTNSSKS